MRLPKIAVFHNRDESRQAITDVTRAPHADSIIAKFSARSTSARDVTPAKSGRLTRTWLCENAGTRNGERRSYSSEAFRLPTRKRIQPIRPIEECHSHRVSMFSVSHSQGHSLPKWAVHPMSFPPIATKLRTSLMARFRTNERHNPHASAVESHHPSPANQQLSSGDPSRRSERTLSQALENASVKRRPVSSS
jgi:hypothetical protein